MIKWIKKKWWLLTEGQCHIGNLETEIRLKKAHINDLKNNVQEEKSKRKEQEYCFSKSMYKLNEEIDHVFKCLSESEHFEFERHCHPEYKYKIQIHTMDKSVCVYNQPISPEVKPIGFRETTLQMKTYSVNTKLAVATNGENELAKSIAALCLTSDITGCIEVVNYD